MTDDAGQPPEKPQPAAAPPKQAMSTMAMVYGMVIGIALGGVLGVTVFDDLGLGLSAGIALGVGIGMAMGLASTDRPSKRSDSDDRRS